jgi:hypothetical protein
MPTDALPVSGERDADGGASVSLMITHAQKAKLREQGYSEEDIRGMAPAEAHRLLGLVG